MNLEEITLGKIKERLKESWDCSVHNNEVEWLIAEVERLQTVEIRLRAHVQAFQKLSEKAETDLIQLKQVLKLRTHQRDTHKQQSSDFIEQNKKAEDRIRELEEGLKPFAEAAKEADKSKISEEAIIWKPQNSFRKTSGISVGDLRKAYSLLEEKER